MGGEQRDRAQKPADEKWEPKWGEPISEERQRELQRRLDTWAAERDHGERKGPFDGELEGGHIELTGADVFWLAERVRRDDFFGNPPGSLPDLHLEGATIRQAELEGAALSGARLQGADLTRAALQGALLSEAELEGADLTGARLQGANLTSARLKGANLSGAQLEGAALWKAHLEAADLHFADLQSADLRQARLEGASLVGAGLQRADLCEASFDKTSRLNNARFDGVALEGVIFDNTNLAVVEWSEVRTLGDEREAKMRGNRLRSALYFRDAARAYRALSVALRTQGLGAHSTRFHYRAELMERYALLYDMRERLLSLRFYIVPFTFLRWLGSWLLGTFAGYGDYVGRLFLAYAVIVCSFALCIFVAGHQSVSVDHLRDALVLSVTSFHGRGLQPPGLPLSDAIATLAGAEGVFGLLIEGIFIAAFTRRVTGG